MARNRSQGADLHLRVSVYTSFCNRPGEVKYPQCTVVHRRCRITPTLRAKAPFACLGLQPIPPLKGCEG